MKEKVKVRQAKLCDIPCLLEIDKEIWPQFRANEEMFYSRIETFPKGQFVATVNGQIVGSIFSQLIDYTDWADRSFTWNEITDNGTVKLTHNPGGDSIYGVGLAVAKKFQGTAASRLLIMTIVQLTVRMDYRQILLGSRIPAYHKHSEISVDEYIRTIRDGSSRLLDPELALYKKYGGEPIKVFPNYMDDPESLNFGVLIKWQNPFYNKPFRRIVAWFLKVWSVLSR